MDIVDEITDPTDWSATSLPYLSRLDNALRCQVCKEFYNSPLITSCSHTFCSLCIRRCLTADQKCPTCRAPEEESRLRRNGVVQELVDAFVGVRGRLMKVAKEGVGGKGGAGGDCESREGSNVPTPISQRTPRKLKRTAKEDVTYSVSTMERDMYEIQNEDEEGDGDEPEGIDDEKEQVMSPSLEAPIDDGKAPCPVCNTRMKVGRIPYHIEACLRRQEEGPDGEFIPKSSSSPKSKNNQLYPIGSRPTKLGPSRLSQPPVSHHPPSNPAQNRLPKINYNLLNQSSLRSKLLELGIPTHGSKQALQARHIEWVNLWNSNLDAVRQKSKRELLAELAAWEKAQTKGTNWGGKPPTKQPGWSDEGWAKEHQQDFKELVEKARKKRKVEEQEGEKSGEGLSEEGAVGEALVDKDERSYGEYMEGMSPKPQVGESSTSTTYSPSIYLHSSDTPSPLPSPGFHLLPPLSNPLQFPQPQPLLFDPYEIPPSSQTRLPPNLYSQLPLSNAATPTAFPNPSNTLPSFASLTHSIPNSTFPTHPPPTASEPPIARVEKRRHSTMETDATGSPTASGPSGPAGASGRSATRRMTRSTSSGSSQTIGVDVT